MSFSLKTSLQCTELTYNCFVPSTIPQRCYSKDYWFSKYGHGCHGGFTMKITDSSNMGTVNHATENLQHRILDFSKYCSVITMCQRKRYRARGTEEQRLARLARRREYDRRRYATAIMTIEQRQRRR